MEPKPQKFKKAVPGIILTGIIVLSVTFIFTARAILAANDNPDGIVTETSTQPKSKQQQWKNLNTASRRLTNPAVTAVKAKELALAKVGGGTITSCETEFEHAKQHYEITIIYQKQEHELEVNAVTGEITAYHVERLEADDYDDHHDKYDLDDDGYNDLDDNYYNDHDRQDSHDDDDYKDRHDDSYDDDDDRYDDSYDDLDDDYDDDLDHDD